MQRALPKPYYLFPKKGKRKTPVIYYRVYADDWSVVGEWSTRCRTRSDADQHCRRLIREGNLIPTINRKPSSSTTNPPLFRDYFADWYDWPKGEYTPRCPYIQKRLKQGKTYSRQNASIQRGNLTKYIMKTFGDRPKNRITRAEVEDWYYTLPEEEGIKPQTATNVFATLRKMMTEAHRLGHITTNPCSGIESLAANRKARDILRLQEVDKLFNRFRQEEIWPEPMAYVGTLLAATTGMRTGEIRELHLEQIHRGYILVDRAGDAMHGTTKKTKSGIDRRVSIPDKLYRHLVELADGTDGFIFSEDGGKTRVPPGFFRNHFYKAMDTIGIKEPQRKQRNIVFHGWRVFANTMMRVNGIEKSVIQDIIGHQDDEMTRHYTNIPEEAYRQKEKYANVDQLQQRILKVVA